MSLKTKLKRVITVFFIIIVGIISVFLLGTQVSMYGSRKRVIEINGVKRSYFIHLPQGYDSSKKYPLVVVLHGYNNSAKIA